MTALEQQVRQQAAALLPRVTADAPAAVLLVDVARREVLFANPLAEQLVPGRALPAPVDAWSDAAGLCDLDGAPLSASAHPLSQVAQGRPVSGQAVSAKRSSDATREREPLWVVAVPLRGAPVLGHCVLVVFLPLRDAEAVQAATTSARESQQVRERAVLATGLAFTVVDARAPDHPLVWVNPAFEMTTGYALQEVVGRNCRFLQGEGTDRAEVARVRAALAAGQAVTATLLNYRKDGTAFWNQLAVSPVLDGAGHLTHFVGVQADVTERRAAELERERALEAERAARHEAERARTSLALLAEATGRLSATLDPAEALDRLAGLVVPELADWAVAGLVDEDGRPGEVAVRHADGLTEVLERVAALQPGGLTAEAPVQQVLRTGRPQLVTGLGREVLASYVADPELLDLVERLGARSCVVVPLQARRRTLGTLALVSATRDYDDDDLVLVADLGRRAALTVDNARLYQREHDAAVLLQRSLLPDLPQVPGITSAARYLPGDTAAQVGGDFYEVLALPDGAVGLAVGDVVGHDLSAAAAMGHLRGLLRACAWDTAADDGADPAVVLSRVDRLVQGLHVAPLATVLYARLRAEAQGWRLDLSSAGHPPLLLREPGARCRPVGGSDLLLGVDGSTPRRSEAVAVPPGSTVVAYTDGLVERRGADLDDGLAWLCEQVDQAGDATPDELCASITAQLPATEDDVALLAVRLHEPPPASPPSLAA